MKEENADIFNFTDEISRGETYRQLYPDEREGIVIAHLYDRLKAGYYENDSFDGEEIDRFFEATMSKREIDVNYVKTLNKQRILRLQKFFLKYDEETQLYSFQEYGLNFCEIAKITLEGVFNPTRIKIICTELKKKLHDAIGNSEEIKKWFSLNFEHFHPTLKQQIDFLDRQIDKAVEKLRNDTLSQEFAPLKLLQTVSDDLVDIQEKNEELRSAFTETYDINSILNTIDTDDVNLLNNIETTSHFFDGVQSRLRNTDRRLDRIQPKIKQLFATLSTPEYSAKTDRFIRFLLNYSELQKCGNNKEILFPKEVSAIDINFKRPKHIFFDRDKNIFPTQPKPRKEYERNPEIEKESKALLEKAFDDSQKIEDWVNLLFAQLNKNKELNISEEFFTVLNESGNFAIATKVTFRVIEDAYIKDKCEVQIDKNTLVEHENTGLWKTTIVQK